MACGYQWTSHTHNNGEWSSDLINEYSEENKKLSSLNAKVVNILYCALERNKFNHIFTCLNAHDIWLLLEVTHEGTNQVKE